MKIICWGTRYILKLKSMISLTTKLMRAPTSDPREKKQCGRFITKLVGILQQHGRIQQIRIPFTSQFAVEIACAAVLQATTSTASRYPVSPGKFNESLNKYFEKEKLPQIYYWFALGGHMAASKISHPNT
ncbi:MAG: hypothetical protein R3C41_14700 [Calditrichia bacterium]